MDREPADIKLDPAADNHNHHPNHARLLTIPNILSISRLFILPLVLFFLFQQQSIAAVLTMLVSWSTDALDGYLARRLNQVSDTGKVLDHLVDKIWIAAVLVTLVYVSDLPLYIAGAVIFRDLLILAGSFVLMKSRGKLVSSDAVGKLTGFAFAMLILFYTLTIDSGHGFLSQFIPPLAHYKPFVDFAVIILIIVSFLNYLVVFLRIMLRFRLPGE
jgi:CDP-diacylglycerol--glycerol-3-phosphate 3-phosphatidyltransferase